MIRSFADKDTERLFRDDLCPAKWRSFEAVAVRKLDMVDAATRLDDLRSPPGNRLEWRICFRWTPDGPENVEIVDYH